MSRQFVADQEFSIHCHESNLIVRSFINIHSEFISQQRTYVRTLHSYFIINIRITWTTFIERVENLHRGVEEKLINLVHLIDCNCTDIRNECGRYCCFSPYWIGYFMITSLQFSVLWPSWMFINLTMFIWWLLFYYHFGNRTSEKFEVAGMPDDG